jgi:hypothetical protein
MDISAEEKQHPEVKQTGGAAPVAGLGHTAKFALSPW